MYRELTGDHSSSTNQHVTKIDKRVQQLIEMEDPEIVVDLHKHNEGEKVNIMSFWTVQKVPSRKCWCCSR